MNNINGIIFDCDGVLFESRKANLAYYNAVLSQFGEPPVDCGRSCQGPSLSHRGQPGGFPAAARR